MSNKKNPVVAAGFTLALLVASSYGDFPGAMASSYGGMARNYCYERTETECTSDEACKTLCLEKGDSYVAGYCSRVMVASTSCICIKKWDAQFRHGAAGLGPASA